MVEMMKTKSQHINTTLLIINKLCANIFSFKNKHFFH